MKKIGFDKFWWFDKHKNLTHLENLTYVLDLKDLINLIKTILTGLTNQMCWTNLKYLRTLIDLANKRYDEFKKCNDLIHLKGFTNLMILTDLIILNDLKIWKFDRYEIFDKF